MSDQNTICICPNTAFEFFSPQLLESVSYTHLDVYKRQVFPILGNNYIFALYLKNLTKSISQRRNKSQRSPNTDYLRDNLAPTRKGSNRL